jgi:3-oxoacyl-[acyl-carrier-protein] synthase II
MGTSINGVGVVGGFGCGLDDLMECLDTGVRSLSSAPDESSSGITYQAYISDTSYLNTIVPKRALRRIDHFSQLALTGAYLAIKDAGLQSLNSKTTGLVICSGYGSAKTTFSFLDSIIDYGDSCASPTLFSNSVHNSAAGYISMLLELEGPSLTVSQFEMSVPSALLSAIQWLQEERVERVLFGAVDECCDVLGYCYQRFFGKKNNMTMAPLASGQQSAIPGEGSVFLLLSKEKSMVRNYGYIRFVNIGNIVDNEITFTKESFFILNADGHKKCDIHYADLIPQGSEAACYTPLYGSIPTGFAFDMAIAALSIKEGKIFSSAKSVGNLMGNQILREGRINKYKDIFCVKVGRQGELGIINLSNNM